MGGLHLLPGEREELRLRPSPWSRVPGYLLAVAPTLVAGGLAVARSTRDAGGQAPAWASPFAIAFAAVATLVLGSLLHWLARRATTSWVLGGAALAWLIVASALLRSTWPDDAVLVALATSGTPILVTVELRRWLTSYHFTNLRIIRRCALPRREDAVLHQDLVDLDARKGLFDSGTLVAVLAEVTPGPGHDPEPRPPLVLRGVHPFGRVRALAELLVQKATATEFIRESEQLDERVATARAALHRQ